MTKILADPVKKKKKKTGDERGKEGVREVVERGGGTPRGADSGQDGT